ncbi:hypothetical protein MNBD_BACTEROID06-349 [hydrothermal vent metagenome]|uniref:Uncharacterized protein n=1 Tax=hydrothermal vent metagenome TaxID=652676 RepID=A0A3B0UC80_9ZZZZ
MGGYYNIYISGYSVYYSKVIKKSAGELWAGSEVNRN